MRRSLVSSTVSLFSSKTVCSMEKGTGEMERGGAASEGPPPSCGGADGQVCGAGGSHALQGGLTLDAREGGHL